MAPGHIRARALRMLRVDAEPRLGTDAWRDLEVQLGAAGAAEAAPDAVVPTETFNRLLRELDQRLGTGDGTYAFEAGRRYARRWGQHYEALVEQLRDRPERLLQLWVQEIHARDLNRSDAATVLRTRENEMLLRFRDGVWAPYRRGLIEGLVALTGAKPETRDGSDETVLVTWKPDHRPQRARAWRTWVHAVRPPFLAATLLPVLVGLAIAAQDGTFNAAWALFTLLGVASFQLATNAINDYYDAQLEPDAPARRGALPPRLARRLAILLYATGILMGLFLVAWRGVEVLWMGLAGFLLGILYSAPPVRLAHRGVGELAVAIGFGPLIVLGTYFVQRQAWSFEAFLASLPLAFLMAAVLFINEFPHKWGDAHVGKRTLIVRLPERSAVVAYVLVLALAYMVMVGGVALQGTSDYAAYAFPAWSLLGLLTLPLAVHGSLALARNYRYPYRLVSANAATVLLHLTTAFLFVIGYLLPLFA